MSDIKNEDDIIIQTIKRKSRTKENKFASLSKEMTTTDQIENSTIPKISSKSYNINYGPDTFRFKNKNPYHFYQQWINQSYQSKINYEINNKEGSFESKSNKFENKMKKNETANKKKPNKKCCLIF